MWSSASLGGGQFIGEVETGRVPDGAGDDAA